MYRDLILNIDESKILFSKELILVCKVTKDIQDKIGDSEIYISEFVVAKIKGFIPKLEGHPEVNNEFFLDLPSLLNNPLEILIENSNRKKRYVICGEPTHRVILEIKRQNNKTEINTIHPIRQSALERMEKKCEKL